MAHQQLDQDTRRRLRPVAAGLMEDISLREGLVDEQAQQLLDWALARLKETAKRAADLPEEEARYILNTQATALRGVMRQVARLTDDLSAGDLADAEARLADFTRALHTVQPETADAGAPDDLLDGRCRGDQPATFDRLMALVRPPAESAPDAPPGAAPDRRGLTAV